MRSFFTRRGSASRISSSNGPGPGTSSPRTGTRPIRVATYPARVSTSLAVSPTSNSPMTAVTSSRLARASARNEPSDWRTTLGAMSSSCSSAISPTICSTMSSIDTTPSAPPYSSTTKARWMRVVCILARRSSTGIEAGGKRLLAPRVGFRGGGGAPRHERDQVADVNHADGVVEGLVVDDHPRMAGALEYLHQLAEHDVLPHRDDIGARHHDVDDPPLAQPEDIPEHRAFGRREAEFGGRRFQRVLEVGAGGARFPAEDRPQRSREPALAVLPRRRPR